jgi:hypothetical protein
MSKHHQILWAHSYDVLSNMYQFGGLIHSFSKFSIKGRILTKIVYESETWFHCIFSCIEKTFTHAYMQLETLNLALIPMLEKNINIKNIEFYVCTILLELTNKDLW